MHSHPPIHTLLNQSPGHSYSEESPSGPKVTKSVNKSTSSAIPSDGGSQSDSSPSSPESSSQIKSPAVAASKQSKNVTHPHPPPLTELTISRPLQIIQFHGVFLLGMGSALLPLLPHGSSAVLAPLPPRSSLLLSRHGRTHRISLLPWLRRACIPWCRRPRLNGTDSQCERPGGGGEKT